MIKKYLQSTVWFLFLILMSAAISAGPMKMTPTGLTFPDSTSQTTAASGGGSTLWNQVTGHPNNIEYTTGNVGIGTNPDALLHLWEFDDSNDDPMLWISQDGDTIGDASLRFFLLDNDYAPDNGFYHVANFSFTIGIDTSDKAGFEIAHHFYNEDEVWGNAPLTGSSYQDANTMLRIHPKEVILTPGPPKVFTEIQTPGIIDFNHQSRARYYIKDKAQTIPNNTWTAVEFDARDYDEHGEVAVQGGKSVFTATETGYYQVNARIEFEFPGETLEAIVGAASADAYVSIAVFHSSSASEPWSKGNNLQIYNQTLRSALSGIGVSNGNAVQSGLLMVNNAPNVSDVIFMNAGDTIEIRAYQNIGVQLPLNHGKMADNYFSVHKSS